MRYSLLVRLALFAAMIALAGCGGSSQPMVGKWKSGNSSTVWEFFENGTLNTDGTPGRYNFGDNKRIKIQTGAATFVYQLKIEGDRMTLTDPGGSAMELTRVK